MTEQEIRQIVRDEIQLSLSYFLKDKFVFPRHLQILDGRNIQLGQTTGTKIGTATTQKLGFYGETPVDQPATVSDPSDSSALYGQANAQETVNAVKAIIDRLQELGLIA